MYVWSEMVLKRWGHGFSQALNLTSTFIGLALVFDKLTVLNFCVVLDLLRYSIFS